MLKKLVGNLLERVRGLPQDVPAMSFSPQERTRHLAGVEAALAEGNRALAQSLVEPLLHADPDDGQALAAAGILAYLNDNFAMACRILERTVELLPSHAQAHKFLAAALYRLGEDPKALAVAERANNLLPYDAQVTNMLGVLYMNAERYDESADQFNKALEATPQDLTPLLNLAALEARGRAHRRRDASRPRAEQIRKQTLNRLMADARRSNLDPADAKILLALTSNSPLHFDTAVQIAEALYSDETLDGTTARLVGQVFTRLGDLPRSIEMCELALEGAPNESGHRIALGQALIAAGDKRWSAAWQMADYDFLRLYRSGSVTEVPLWSGQRLGQQRLFVYQDQGFGDVLLALRFLRTLSDRGTRPVFWVKPDLAPVLRSCEYCGELVVSEIRPDARSLNCAAAAPLFSLVRLLKLRPVDLKQPALIQAPRDRCIEWRAEVAKISGLRVGLVATGNPWRHDDWFRSIPPGALTPLQQVQGVTWVNLAVDARPEREETIAMLRMIDPTADFHDFGDTAAVTDALDAVVAIDCSVAHLAGALGKPVFVLAPSSIDWRWQIGADTQPWWPSAQLFRSPKPMRWEEPIKCVASELSRLANAARRTSGH
jgi:Flp pilus assembly protein TadD